MANNINTNNIPQELKDLKQWHPWKFINGTQKLPVQANGDPAKSNDPTTWTDFESALDASQFYAGLAFELTEPYTGIDLDDCLDHDGRLKSWALPIVARFDGKALIEFSPSGTGMKITTRGRKPSGARCVASMGEGKQQVECYDNKRFWAITGLPYNSNTEIQDAQKEINWLCSEYLEPTTSEATAPQLLHPPGPSFIGSRLENRARAYVDSVPYNGGGRNNAIFNLSGHLWALRGDLGETLDEASIADFARYWNSKLGEPLPDNELLTAVNSAGKNGTRRADKTPQPFDIEDNSDVDISFLQSRDEPTERTKTVTEEQGTESFPAEFIQIPGLLGDIIDYNLSTAMYPLPELALAGALALMSTITGGKVEAMRGRSNLFVMGLSPSGAGKDYARKINRNILRESGYPQYCGPERIGSHAGIISALQEQWNQLLQIDEVGGLLATMSDSRSPHLYNISNVLMQLYTSSDSIWQADAYADRSKVKTLEFPHCVVYGTGVIEGFWESLTSESLSGGLIGRCLVFEEPKYVDFVDAPDRKLPESIIARAKMWLDHRTHDGNMGHEGSSPQVILADEQARERLVQHNHKMCSRRNNESPTESAIWTRAPEKTNKLALLFACSRWEGETWPTIRLQDAELAIKLNNWLTRRVLNRAELHISDSGYQRDCLKLLRTLKTRPEWTMTEIIRKARWCNAKLRDDLLLGLIEQGEVNVYESTDDTGRTTKTVRALVC